MKNVILAALVGATTVPVQAQLFSDNALGGAALGGLIGGIVGHNSGRHTAEGIGIGAGAGLLLGALANHSQATYGEVQVAPWAPVYAAPQRPNYGVTGAVLGGIAGGVIGHNTGRHTAEGIAIGAASGLLLGSIAEQQAQSQIQVQTVPSAPVYVVQTTPTPASQPVRIAPPHTATATPINIYHAAPTSAMTAANSLFGR